LGRFSNVIFNLFSLYLLSKVKREPTNNDVADWLLYRFKLFVAKKHRFLVGDL